MKIKVDENLPLGIVRRLRELGHDVHSVFDEKLGGHPDADIWQACCSEERFLITQDLDFSDARKYRPGSHHGILLVRMSEDSRQNLTRSVVQVFTTNDTSTWTGAMVVLTDVKLRIKFRAS